MLSRCYCPVTRSQKKISCNHDKMLDNIMYI
nr:MAG TPA: hypothetical protein [Caudoviricetes sp.]